MIAGHSTAALSGQMVEVIYCGGIISGPLNAHLRFTGQAFDLFDLGYNVQNFTGLGGTWAHSLIDDVVGDSNGKFHGAAFRFNGAAIKSAR